MATVFGRTANADQGGCGPRGVANAKPFAVAAQIVEGALYTALSALGNVNGVLAWRPT